MQIFVIGAFHTGFSHFSKIDRLAESSQTAVARGRAMDLKVGYPAYCMNGEFGVSGTVFKFASSTTTSKLFDQFFGYNEQNPEKSLYLKENIRVYLEDGAEQEVIAYPLNPSKTPKYAKEIPMGDWVSFYVSQKPIHESLNEEERDYISRLSKAKGREIVPIDLNIYRNLMRDGIIVDKGRRVALSKLGKEVNKYLQL